LLAFLGCTPLDLTDKSIAGAVSVSMLTPQTLWLQYGVKAVALDLRHLHDLENYFVSWAAIRLLSTQKIRNFLRAHSSVFRSLRTSRGRNGQIDRLYTIIQASTANDHVVRL
jgi:hypothetical protein